MASVDRLLKRLRELEEAVDYTSNDSLPDSVKNLTMRGVAVQGLSAFEQFLRERGEEWSNSLTNARVSASRLPGGTVPYSDRIVQTLPKRFRDLNNSDRQALVDKLAQTLASFSSGSVVGHNLFFAWTGSNIQTSDVETVVKLVGVSRGWSELTATWKIVDPRFPGNSSAESKMESFTTLRHSLAHSPDVAVDPIAVRAVPGNVRLTALLIDLCVSEAISSISQGKDIASGFGSSFKVRAIKRDGMKWSEYAPGKDRAFRRHDDREQAISEASTRARRKGEVVIVYNAHEILDWRGAI